MIRAVMVAMFAQLVCASPVLRDDSCITCGRGPSSVQTGDGTAATGIGSTAAGYYTIATLDQCFATGSYTAATGYRSFAAGLNTTASGEESFAIGSFTRASGIASFATGVSTYAIGDYSLTSGYGCNASGPNSAAIGDYTTATGSHGFATNSHTVASGPNSFASGYSSQAGGNCSFAAGSLTYTNASFSVAMGRSITAQQSESLAVSGDVYAENFLFRADPRLVTDITPTEPAAMLQQVQQLSVVDYSASRSLCAHQGLKLDECMASRTTGLLAPKGTAALRSGTSLRLMDRQTTNDRHELETVDGVQSLDMRLVIAQLVGGMQAQSKQIEALKKENGIQRKQIQMLSQKMWVQNEQDIGVRAPGKH